ncbi:excalibur calcium-binding domain-containing protein [Streptomyces albipurpureus]|uniref:Excalibur calcium-binding domain-containing protein n=1 Tax=Streptomyces albipurpureus TaxID=2897419 RepID=A0ABT0UI03_9ACTN|nr:excalibur calcium-binding domain-containing protein [Streptomyces sp. CWNU-1]MCM2387654.1 excalibur calcium-binding domain-containing protein [Streptomyces sp. CWNU-1]
MSNQYPPHPYGPTPPPAAGGGTPLDGKRKTLFGCGGMVAIAVVLAAIVGSCAPDEVVKTKAVPGPTITVTRTVTAPPPAPPTTTPATTPATATATATTAPSPVREETKPSTPKPKPKPKSTPKPKPTPAADDSGGSTSTGGGGADVYYKNCTAVRAAGADPIRRGDPGYGSHLDRDGDGVACE